MFAKYALYCFVYIFIYKYIYLMVTGIDFMIWFEIIQKSFAWDHSWFTIAALFYFVFKE